MLQRTLSLTFPIFFLILSLLSVSTANSIIYVECSQVYFTSTTSYESNINSLFTSLVDSSSISNFNKFQICPPGDPQINVVFGLYQCRGDLSSSNCRDCVANSVSQLKTSCPVSTGGNIQFEGCFVKYNCTPFFGVDDKVEVSKKCGPSIGYNSGVLNLVDDALSYLTIANGQYFRKCSFEGVVHSVAQCVQDLTVNDCEDCLLEARARLRSECQTSTWGNIYLGKCFIRYAHQDNNNDANNDIYDYNDYDDDNDDDDDDDRSKRKRKKRKNKNLKQLRRWSITIGATVGGITSTGSFGIIVVILYKKHKRDKRRPTRPIKFVTLSPPESSRPPPPSPPPPPPPPSPPPPPPSPPPPPPPPPGHCCNVVGGCTCPLSAPFAETFYGERNTPYGIPCQCYRW